MSKLKKNGNKFGNYENNNEVSLLFEKTRELSRKNKEVLLVERRDEFRGVICKIYNTLEERGYDGVNQLVAYLLSEDPTYITSYKNARKDITSFDRNEILKAVVRHYVK